MARLFATILRGVSLILFVLLCRTDIRDRELEEEEEEILGSDDEEQEDPKDYCKGKKDSVTTRF